ncbi:transposase [Parapedobacter defluvii]|nr:transposase [Parapedobacter defluvii]
MKNINACRQRFVVKAVTLFLSIKGRVNFQQLGRYGKYSEQRYRIQFEKPFDFMEFNCSLVREHASGHYIIALDPSFIAKSGRQTPGIGYFWSGQAARTKRGLEMLGMAAIDVDNHTGFHLDACQTLTGNHPDRSLAGIYADCFTGHSEKLSELSRVAVADAWFTKKSFIDAVCGAGFQFVGRMRDDANLKYLYTGPQKPGRGRPRVYDSKVNHQDIKTEHFPEVVLEDGTLATTAVVYAVSLRRKVRVVRVPFDKKHRLYFSTDTEMDAATIVRYYRLRFQIEFIYRDAKQFTGLENCQARSENKLDSHFNMALTATNVAKVAHWISIPKKERGAFSIADIKTMNHNALLMDRFFSTFGVNPHLRKNQKHVKELLLYGTIAA